MCKVFERTIPLRLDEIKVEQKIAQPLTSKSKSNIERKVCNDRRGIFFFSPKSLNFLLLRRRQREGKMSRRGQQPELGGWGWTLGPGSVHSFLSISPHPGPLLQLSVKGWEKPDSNADNHRLIRGCIGSRLTLRRRLRALADTRRAGLKHECTHRAGVIMVHYDTFEKKKKKKACHYRWTSVCKDVDIGWSGNTPQVARDPDYFPFFLTLDLRKCRWTETDTDYFIVWQFSH